jgi:hypothetical protein
MEPKEPKAIPEQWVSKEKPVHRELKETKETRESMEPQERLV